MRWLQADSMINSMRWRHVKLKRSQFTVLTHLQFWLLSALFFLSPLCISCEVLTDLGLSSSSAPSIEEDDPGELIRKARSKLLDDNIQGVKGLWSEWYEELEKLADHRLSLIHI